MLARGANEVGSNYSLRSRAACASPCQLAELGRKGFAQTRTCSLYPSKRLTGLTGHSPPPTLLVRTAAALTVNDHASAAMASETMLCGSSTAICCDEAHPTVQAPPWDSKAFANMLADQACSGCVQPTFMEECQECEEAAADHSMGKVDCHDQAACTAACDFALPPIPEMDDASFQQLVSRALPFLLIVQRSESIRSWPAAAVRPALLLSLAAGETATSLSPLTPTSRFTSIKPISVYPTSQRPLPLAPLPFPLPLSSSTQYLAAANGTTAKWTSKFRR